MSGRWLDARAVNEEALKARQSEKHTGQPPLPLPRTYRESASQQMPAERFETNESCRHLRMPFKGYRMLKKKKKT